MAVHVPLSMEAQAEARFLMLCANNILKPQDGKPVISPSQDMVIGCYYLSCIRPGAKGEGRCFANEDEAMMAYLCGQIDLQSRITVRIARKWDGEVTPEYMAENHITGGNRDHIYYKRIETCLGRLILNSNVPQDMGFKPRNTLNDMFELEIDMKVGKKQLGQIVDMCFRKHGVSETARVLDNVKAMGYKYSTIGAVTVAVADVIVPPEKKPILEASEKKVRAIEKQFKRGLLTDEERYERVVEVWSKTTDDVKSKIMDYMDEFNPIRMMTDSGARGSISQVSQLAGMRGMMASPTGRPLEMPVKANFREGLTVLEFFQSSHGSRKALSDTALRTADSGYLTRRLVDVSQEVIIREQDCFASRHEKIRGITVTAIGSERDPIEKLIDRIVGRVAAEDVINPLTGEVIVPCNEMISFEKGNEIINCGIKAVQIRSVLTCRNETGICVKCYGQDLAHGGYVNIGEAVGIVAAQAIGEPGTQLTMRTFHTGGVASEKDITQGLPRVEELFEARKPKREAMLAEISGTISLGENKKKREMIITSDDGSMKAYPIAYGSRLKVKEGDRVVAGADRRPDQPARPAAHPRREGRSGAPAQGGSDGLPPPGRWHRRQAHRGHRSPDAAQGSRRGRGRHQHAARLDGGYLPLREGEREDHYERRPSGGCQAHPAGHHQGRAGHRVLPLRRLLPRDDPRAHRSRDQGQGRSARRPQGERNPRQAHPGRHGYAALQGCRSQGNVLILILVKMA